MIEPKKYFSEVMRLAYDTPLAGHLGTKKVISQWYWPGMYGVVRRHCTSCDVCQKTVANLGNCTESTTEYHASNKYTIQMSNSCLGRTNWPKY